MNKLQIIIEQNSGGKRAMKHWTLGNLVMFSATKDPEHARRAVHGLADLLKESSLSLHRLCQMCSLCFLSNIDMMDVFKDLPPRSILQIIDQLLAQIEHPNKRIRKRVKLIIEKFTENHIQAVAFPLVFMVREATQAGRDSPHLFDFEKLVRNNHSQFWAEIEKIADGLTELGFTKREQVKQIIDWGYHLYDKTGDPRTLITHLGRLFEFDPSPLSAIRRNNKSLPVELRRAVKKQDEAV
jgi:hypothetical protein